MSEHQRSSSAAAGGSPPGLRRSCAAAGGGRGRLSDGWRCLLSLVILLLACLCGFSSRLFAVIRFESIIHEFDPWLELPI